MVQQTCCNDTHVVVAAKSPAMRDVLLQHSDDPICTFTLMRQHGAIEEDGLGSTSLAVHPQSLKSLEISWKL